MRPFRPAPLHRLAGLALALPLLLWMGTGALFHLEHRYGEAYEPLAAPPPPAVAWGEARVAPAQLGAGAGALNRFIDLTYELHSLRWTPWPPVNLALLCVAMPAMVALALSGVWLWARRRR